MPYTRYFLLSLLLSLFSCVVYAQSPVSIFIHNSPNLVDSSLVSEIYSQAGFSPDITLSAINTTLNINNYKVAFIAEGYAYDNTISDFAGVFLTENERQIV